MEKIKSYKIKIDETKYTEFRHSLHKIPELCFLEIKTKKFLLDYIKTLNNYEKIKIKEVGDTGFFIDVFGEGKEDPQLTPSGSKFLGLEFRADMDGLPLNEETGVDYKSTHEGRAHACGHDGHMTVLTCFLDYVLNRLSSIPSNVMLRFLYQPAEEGGPGAPIMIDGGCLTDIQEIYGQHNNTMFNLGEIGIKTGAIMASVDFFTIEITGTGGHGSLPSLTRSPITTGAEIVLKLNQITSQRIDSIERCVVSIGEFESGKVGNVIPEKAEIRGTIRTLNVEVKENIKKIIVDTCNSIAACNEVKVKVDIVCPGTVTNNNKELTNNIVVKAIEKAGFGLTENNLPSMGSEDFSFYQEKIPGVFMMLGTKDPEHEYYIHSPNFNYNDKGIPYGVELFCRILEVRLGINLVE